MNRQSTSDNSTRAFLAAPDPQRYFPAAVMEGARQKVGRTIERAEGPSLVIGAAGTGKTLLSEVLAEQFQGRIQIVSLPGAQLCSRRALLQMILFQLDLPYRDLDEGELRLSLQCYLRPQGAPALRLLLLVDEADSLPERLLEELRVLTNLVDQGNLLVSLVLFGSANLEERFAEPKLEVFSQRVATRCYLAPLGREETFQYARAQVAAVGGEPDELFTDDGLEAIYAATDGVPRLINQLGDQLLWTANETGYLPLDAGIVQQAWSELQQLPAPWNTAPVETSDAIVEFGELLVDDDSAIESTIEEENEDLPASIPISVSHNKTCQNHESLGEKTTTFDATEDVLTQLDELETTDFILSSNPFTESFESEEVVLDQYLGFEGQLLASAQRVVNRADTAFSQTLKQCEVAEPIPPQVVASAGATEDSKEPSVGPVISSSAHLEDATKPIEATELEEPTEVGELLIVEDGGCPKVTVVPGQKLRQLFSNLESGSNMPSLG